MPDVLQYFYEVAATALRDMRQRMDGASLGEVLRALAVHDKTCDVDAPYRACTAGHCFSPFAATLRVPVATSRPRGITQA